MKNNEKSRRTENQGHSSTSLMVDTGFVELNMLSTQICLISPSAYCQFTSFI